MTRSNASARAAGARFERAIADCQRCGARLPESTPGRGGVQSRRRFCSSKCKNAARNAARRVPALVVCARCGQERRLLNPSLAGAMCRACASAVGSAAAAPVNTQDPLDRFAAFVALTDGGCWEWLGTCAPNGYSSFAVGGRTVRGHRWSYEHFVGAIPTGLEIDHLCRNRKCVNPSHLETVTRAENMRRAREAAA